MQRKIGEEPYVVIENGKQVTRWKPLYEDEGPVDVTWHSVDRHIYPEEED